MYSTDVFRGKIYQGFLPTPMWPAFPPSVRRSFQAVDRSLGAAGQGAFDPETLSLALVHDRADRAEREPGVMQAFAFTSALDRIGRPELLRINALATGHANADFRRTPVWVGGPGPETSWHIGSPAQHLPKLVNSILANATRPDLPASLRAAVALVRLLQVHPFRDGNGRTARVFACWVMARSLGHAPGIAGLLASLWQRDEFDLHSASVAIRDAGDWQPYFDRILAWSNHAGIAKHH